MVIAGIDPGSRYTGYGVIELTGQRWQHVASGVIHLVSQKNLSLRLAKLHCELDIIFKRFQPGTAAIEKVFLGKSVESAFTLGHARGVCLSVAGSSGCDIIECSPRSVKKGVVGYGAASKLQVERMICSALGVQEIERHDAADALAIALFAGRQQLAKERIRGQAGKNAVPENKI